MLAAFQGTERPVALKRAAGNKAEENWRQEGGHLILLDLGQLQRQRSKVRLGLTGSATKPFQALGLPP